MYNWLGILSVLYRVLSLHNYKIIIFQKTIKFVYLFVSICALRAISMIILATETPIYLVFAAACNIKNYLYPSQSYLLTLREKEKVAKWSI